MPPETKDRCDRALRGRVIKVPYDEWLAGARVGRYEAPKASSCTRSTTTACDGRQRTIGLELLEQSATSTTVVIPYGGGGLLTGSRATVKAERPDVRIVAAEPATGAPVAATAGGRRPTAVDYQRRSWTAPASRS